MPFMPCFSYIYKGGEIKMNKKQEVIDALTNFRKLAYQLLEVFDNAEKELINKYPFQKSFDKVVDDIDDWAENTITELKIIIKK